MNKKRTVPVALQLYSVRGDMEQDFEGTLRAVGEMGYDGVELVGLYGRKPEAVREAVAAAGLVPVSAHVPYAEMAADPDGVMTAYAAAGCAYIAVPYLEEAFRRDRRPAEAGRGRRTGGADPALSQSRFRIYKG